MDCVMNDPDLYLSKVLTSLIKRKGITIKSLFQNYSSPVTDSPWLAGSKAIYQGALDSVENVADQLEVNLNYLCFGAVPQGNGRMRIHEQLAWEFSKTF